jgi:hypothetical protein
MTRLWMCIPALLLLAVSVSQATALEKDTYVIGVGKCFNWCDSHNSTQKSRSACYGRCAAYWLRNASDSSTIHSPVTPIPPAPSPGGQASPGGVQ